MTALVLVAPAAAYAAGGVAIEHAPVECVLYDRYPRIAATGAPAEAVASAQLQFRAAGDGDWYSIGMAAEETGWSAFLPRPTRPLAALEYRIVMRAKDAGEAATAPVAARVEAECGSGAASEGALDAPIVVRVPRGAPLVPPVPAGFSPAGVVAFEEQVRKSAVKTALLGAGLAAGIAAGVALGGAAASDSPEVDEVPGFQFSRTLPVPGSVLSSSGNPLSVFLLVSGRVRPPIRFDWTFELLGVGADTVCVSMNGPVSVSSFLPVTVTLTAPLNPSGACGERFDVDRSRLRVSMNGRTVFDEIQTPMPFRFEP